MWSTVWTGISRTALLVGGGISGASAVTLARVWEQDRAVKAGKYYESSGQYYQLVGHAWDHYRRDFSVVYRPLFHCTAQEGRSEAHVLATADFEHFGHFREVGYHDLSVSAKNMTLPGPFWRDESWGEPALTTAVQGCDGALARQHELAAVVQAAAQTSTRSGYGTRSHQSYATADAS
eukprot:TRINITY_DN69146_c0_g1_i1.p1 TRINITY_DN69146_c0_g1~~TRINITY_DN69146_c0_g1_i1.p1  ORF type:complete len:178 (-),score=20.81 TRINITY_DN69146_c0_g1_i1:134-667(-)